MMQISSHCQTLWEKLPVIISFRVSYPDKLFDSSAITLISEVAAIIMEKKKKNAFRPCI